MTVRTRFAPSPTGYLHIGGARTALYSWLFARKHGGAFILRIEDTDLERSTAESVNAILEGITWLGLEYDEGPFFQTQRFDRYQEVVHALLESGQAYPCYCTREELEEMRAMQLARKEKPRYDGRCQTRRGPAPTDRKPVIRFKNPVDGTVVVDDLIKGRVVFQNTELDDLIIARPDGSPTYNFAVVVDDWDMRITHVVRGDDHLNNTPRQMNILQALGAPIPVYAHVPMILGSDGQRLSKRHGAVSVMQYRQDGFLPEALLNYLARLGWSHGDQEIFSVDEMIELFDLTDVHGSAATFDPMKLLWLNQHYIKSSRPEHVAHHLSWHMGQLGIDPSRGPELVEVVKAQAERAKTLSEMAANSAFFYQEFTAYEARDATKYLVPAVLNPLTEVRNAFETLTPWSADAIHDAIQRVAQSCNLKLGQLAQPLRVALAGRAVSPPIDVTTYLIGKERGLSRIDKAIRRIHEHISA